MTEHRLPDGDYYAVTIKLQMPYPEPAETYDPVEMHIPHASGWEMSYLVEPVCWRVCITRRAEDVRLRVENLNGRPLYETYTRLPSYGSVYGFNFRHGDDWQPATLTLWRTSQETP